VSIIRKFRTHAQTTFDVPQSGHYGVCEPALQTNGVHGDSDASGTRTLQSALTDLIASNSSRIAFFGMLTGGLDFDRKHSPSSGAFINARRHYSAVLTEPRSELSVGTETLRSVLKRLEFHVPQTHRTHPEGLMNGKRLVEGVLSIALIAVFWCRLVLLRVLS
jgi:hypothetical protein